MKKHWDKFKNWLYGPERIRGVETWSKRVSLPGFNNVPVYNIATFIYGELRKDDIVTRANSVAYSFFLSIFPFVIFILPIITFIPWVAQRIEQFQNNLQGVIPQYAIEYVEQIIEGIKPEGIYGYQGIGILFAALFASSGMLTLMYGFDKSYDISFKSRSYLKKRWIALVLTILLSLMLLLAIVLMVTGEQYLQQIMSDPRVGSFGTFLFILIRWFGIFSLFYLVITIIYRYGPSMYRPLKFINPGAIVATVFSFAATVGFFFFLNNFGKYNEIYGSIATLIIILLWLQINAFIILAGFELNASIIVNRDAQILDID